MANKIRCPLCGFYAKKGGYNDSWGCLNQYCKCYDEASGEAYDKLIETTKDLLTVKKALKQAIKSLEAAEFVCILEGHKFTAQAIRADINEIKKALKKPKRKDK